MVKPRSRKGGIPMTFEVLEGEDESYILYLLETRKRVTNAELCKLLNLSTSTVRKKLARMEQQGLLLRTYGGAASLDAERDETIGKKTRLNLPQKRAIATAASKFLRDGTRIALGGSSTVAELTSYVLKLKKTVVFTDSTLIASLISRSRELEVRINSGIVRSRTGCIVGPCAQDLFKNHYVQRAFVGCDSFSLESGAGSDNILVGQVERSILLCARERYVLCDSTKLNQPSVCSYASLPEITALITDSDANPEFITRLREKGLTVIVADVPRI